MKAKCLFGRANFEVSEFDYIYGGISSHLPAYAKSKISELDDFQLNPIANRGKVHLKISKRFNKTSVINFNTTTFDDDSVIIMNLSHDQYFKKIKKGYNSYKLIDNYGYSFQGYLEMHQNYKNIILSANVKNFNSTNGQIKIYAKYVIENNKNVTFTDFPSENDYTITSIFDSLNTVR